MKKMRRIHAARTVRRWAAFLLCAALVGGMVSKALPALAVDNVDEVDNVDNVDNVDEVNNVDSVDVYCEHHTEHTAECGYVEAVEGQPCTHEHNEECSYVEGQPCTHEHDEECGYEEGQPCIHTHDEECGYTEAVEGQPCTHEHDENCEVEGCAHEHDESCGYVEAVEGQPCTHGHDENCGYAEGQPCNHEHNEQCGYLEVTECTHEHDEDCGYVETVEGQPCRFVCEICGVGSEEEPEEELEEGSEQIEAMAAAEPAASGDVQEKGLIAAFSFDDPSNRLLDYSGKDVGVSLHKLVNQGEDGKVDWRVSGDSIADVSEYFEERDDKSGENNSALHLNDNACLVLDVKELLKGFEYLTEMTVEMQVKLDETNSGQNWLFYAAPNDSPAGDNRRCLGLGFLENNQELVAQRYNSGGGDPVAGKEGRVAASSGINDGTWHTVRVIYKVSSMALYVDENRVAEGSAPNKLADYFGEDKDSVIWFGHSGWTNNSNFNGYIDDIKIYNYANYDGLDIGPIDKEKYILTPTEPPETTVNMFDYWITGQMDNDYNPLLDQDTVLDSGINDNHLFLFAGSDVSSGNWSPTTSPTTTSVVGAWNNYEYGGHDRNGYEHQKTEPYQGIVGNLLDDNGYPQLAIDELTKSPEVEIPDTLTGRPTTESLAYLFDPNKEHDGKDAYRDVSGLFRLNDEGYYYFKSNETFAELNIEQGDGAKTDKTDTGGNHITLYKEPWNIKSGDATLGQFFPFNDGSDLFYIGDSGELVQAHSRAEKELWDQSTTSEPMNHYFGMTVETKFTQPENGKLHYEGEDRDMIFEFSGDDDVWIFIDDVLVGDLGGLHNRVLITIDYATGEINYEGNLGSDGVTGTQHLTGFDTTLSEIFENAGRDISDWPGEGKNKRFPDGSPHTLKFFYLERGNNMSNCYIRFNVLDEPPEDDNDPENPTTPPEEDPPTTPPEENPPENEDPENPTPPNPPKKDKPKNPPTEQPPEEHKPVDPPTVQPPEENRPTNPPTVQPPEQESEARTLGVLASPNTGDSNMVGLWFTLLVFSTAGIVAIRYRTRKR